MAKDTLSKRSRYYRLDEVAFPGRDGIERRTRALRRTPGVAGQFLHTLEANDRLDHLAYKYYRQSLHWWRICDANPEFADPLALLGKTPAAEIRLELKWSDGVPPLAELYATLADVTGILRVVKGGNGLPALEIRDGAPAVLFTLPGALTTELDAAVIGQSLPGALDTALQAEGLTLPSALRCSRPEENLWHIEDPAAAGLYRLRYSGDTGLISVNKAVQEYLIELFITYNRNSVTQQSITGAIEALQFEVEEAAPVTRLGLGIVIPPRYTGRD